MSLTKMVVTTWLAGSGFAICAWSCGQDTLTGTSGQGTSKQSVRLMAKNWELGATCCVAPVQSSHSLSEVGVGAWIWYSGPRAHGALMGLHRLFEVGVGATDSNSSLSHTVRRAQERAMRADCGETSNSSSLQLTSRRRTSLRTRLEKRGRNWYAPSSVSSAVALLSV